MFSTERDLILSGNPDSNLICTKFSKDKFRWVTVYAISLYVVEEKTWCVPRILSCGMKVFIQNGRDVADGKSCAVIFARVAVVLGAIIVHEI